MLPWVIATQPVSVTEVCERFGYTRRDLLADLDLVFVCGLPGYGPGDLMVAYVEDEQVIVDTADYFGAAPRLNPAESIALLAAGMTMVATGQGSEALDSAVEKLSRTLLPEGEDLLSVDIDPQAKLTGELGRAVASHLVCEIEYRALANDETTIRRIEPWLVFTSLGNWYVSAFCRRAGSERVFRVDRIRSLSVSSELFDPPPNLPEREVRYRPRPGDAIAVIELSASAAWVNEYYPVEIMSVDGGITTISFSASDPAVAARLLLRLGASARLIDGEAVAERLAQMRQSILARYGQ